MFSTSSVHAQLASLSMSLVNFTRRAAAFQTVDESMMMVWVTITPEKLGEVSLHAYPFVGLGVVKWDLKGSTFKTDKKRKRFPTKRVINTWVSLP